MASQELLYTPKQGPYTLRNEIAVGHALGMANFAIAERYLHHHAEHYDGMRENDPVGYMELRNNTADILTQDVYAHNGQAVTIATYVEDHPILSPDDPVGTVRLVFSRDNEGNSQTLEMHDLIENTPDILAGVKLSKVAEGGRMTVHPLLSASGEKRTKEIFEHTFEGEGGVIPVLLEEGIEALVMTSQYRLDRNLPPRFRRRKQPRKYQRQHDVLLTPAGRTIAELYPGYWKHEKDPPKGKLTKIK